MKIGIINTGNVGRTLALPWYNAGHELMLAKAGSQDKLNEFASTLEGIQKGTAIDAAKFGDVALFSVYWPNVDATIAEVGDLAGKVVIDTMNPLLVNEAFEHYHDVEFMKNSSTAEYLQEKMSKAKIVKAFSTMPAQALDSRVWASSSEKPPIFIASDHADAKETVRQLAKDAGFDAVDIGALQNARQLEQMGILLHHVAVNQFDGKYEYLAPSFLQARV